MSATEPQRAEEHRGPLARVIDRMNVRLKVAMCAVAGLVATICVTVLSVVTIRMVAGRIAETDPDLAAQLQFAQVAIVVFFFVSATLGWLFVRKVSQSMVVPLRQLTSAMEAMAAGDLTRALHVSSQDEIGRSARAAEATRAD